VLNKHLIMDYCRQRQISVTEKDVNDEIDRMARKFGIATDQYLKMLKQERGIKPEQYASDIVWPMLALRRLAKDQITPTKEEIQKAFEAQYGEAIKTRIIVLDSAEVARRVQSQAAQNPDDFGALAKNHSKDPSASMNGMIQPIRRHVGHAAIEKAAFALQEGQVSQVITLTLGEGEKREALTQFVILKCEGRLPPMKVNPELVGERLRESIVEGKLRNAAAEIFKKLQNESRVENVYNDAVKREQMPGIAAIVNDHKITLRELAEECLARHGVEVLEGAISRRLLEQALKQRNLAVTPGDIDGEIARAALAMGQKTADGKPDVQKWLTMVREEQGLPIDVYRRDSVWPSVALKKLAGDVQITRDDLQKGYEANYGKRVRCRAIVLANQRRAQEVWEKARANLTPEFFGQLAEEYSVEASSKALQGKVPPIQRHGGQPLLEKEAFSLKPGEMSSIIQVGDKFVILLCEGYTEPTTVTFNEVREDIYNDIYEKKQRIAMAEVFNQLKESAQIDNFLAGTVQSPNKKASHTTAASPKQPATPKSAQNAGASRTKPRTTATR
jgi:parvulin-like peptidyl-prolyl isomerase